jgi:hypothetical protein
VEITQQSPAPSRKAGGLSPWFSLLGGGIAWVLHLLVGYTIAEFGCLMNAGDRLFFGITGVAWLLILASIAAMGLAALATWVAYRGEQRSPPIEPETVNLARPDRYVVRLGMITNLIFIVIIIAQSIPIFFFLRSC